MWVIFTRSKPGQEVNRLHTYLHLQYIGGMCKDLMQDNRFYWLKSEWPIVVFAQVPSQTLRWRTLPFDRPVLMPLKDSVHPLCSLGRCSLVTAEAFQKQHFKTRCTVLSVMSFTIYRFYPNTHTLKMEGSTSLSSIRNGVLRYFNAEACPGSRSMRLDLQPGVIIESGTFSQTISFSTSVPSPTFK